MPSIHRLALAAATVALSSACASGTNQVPDSAAPLPAGPATTSVASATTSATPSETPGAKHGAQHKTSVFHLTDKDGYLAEVTVRWYAETAMTPADLLPGCLPSRFSDRANTCHTDQDLDSPAEIQTFSLSPRSPKATLMWVRSAKKTPDNPDGTVHSEPDRYNVRSSLYLKSCDGTGLEKGILDCTSAYGLDR